MKDEALTMRESQDPRMYLGRLEQLIRSELGPLQAGVEPLLGEVRAGVAALYPEAGATRLSPKEHQAQHAKLLQTLDGLEEVLEALQLAARTGRGKG
ncbi:hypothetical protein SAMN05444354_109212 [Stigmatella aurantiaca]|uniref:Uncharacterized protein n=1 Tax=Stigmatella aurantiaca TaxID=41 RepID=A0A1H7TYE2_STIAU|nr:hypothetical protein [Stigmatella aurantiaca]SEL89478.1 hypothetical protein SAMN05444354_109212 [Stigmatella aurantiaca]